MEKLANFLISGWGMTAMILLAAALLCSAIASCNKTLEEETAACLRKTASLMAACLKDGQSEYRCRIEVEQNRGCWVLSTKATQ